mgnify:CR=1 FL=1
MHKIKTMKTSKQPVKKVQRLENRAQRVMNRAQKTWSKGEAARKNQDPKSETEGSYIERKFEKAARQESRAKRIANRASFLRDKSGMAPSPLKTQSKSKSIITGTTRKRGM